MIILNFGIFKLSDIDQGVHQHPIQKKKEFSAFLKKKLSEKKVKANFIASRTTLCTQNIKFCMQIFFSKNVCLRTTIDLRLKKKNEKIFGPNFQNYLKNFLCRHQKNASHTISIYGNCMMSIFFKKRKPQFFITRLFY